MSFIKKDFIMSNRLLYFQERQVLNFPISKLQIIFCFILSVLFVAVFFLLDYMVPNDFYWFQRSGAVLCILAISAEFSLNKLDRTASINSLNDALDFNNSLKTGVIKDTKFDKRVRRTTHACVAAGTLIWAYGDIPFRLLKI
jgi:hypothetical protein